MVPVVGNLNNRKTCRPWFFGFELIVISVTMGLVNLVPTGSILWRDATVPSGETQRYHYPVVYGYGDTSRRPEPLERSSKRLSVP